MVLCTIYFEVVLNSRTVQLQDEFTTLRRWFHTFIHKHPY